MSNREEQLEAISVLKDVNEKLVGNMKILIRELSGDRKEDTDALLKSVVDTLNWEIQVVNATLETINEGEERIEKARFNEVITALGNALASNKDAELVKEFGNVVALLEKLGEALEAVK